MATLVDAVDALLSDPADVVLASSILGTADATVIAERVEAFVASELGRRVVACRFVSQSVGSVFGLDLDDGTSVVVKAHALGGAMGGFASFDELDAVYAAQRELAAAGLPCAQVHCGPRPFGAGVAAVMSYIEPDVRDDPHAVTTRRALAAGLASIVELGHSLSERTRSRLPRSILPPTVFPKPHNALFDFAKPGGEWIDARARAARAILDEVAPAPVVMHTDFSCANVRIADGAIAAVFDMDSVAWIDEGRCVASAAVHFTYTGETWRWPSRDEARAFVADYEAARGPFTTADHRRIDAAMAYAMAYTARCEHGSASPGSDHSMIDALAALDG